MAARSQPRVWEAGNSRCEKQVRAHCSELKLGTLRLCLQMPDGSTKIPKMPNKKCVSLKIYVHLIKDAYWQLALPTFTLYCTKWVLSILPTHTLYLENVNPKEKETNSIRSTHIPFIYSQVYFCHIITSHLPIFLSQIVWLECLNRTQAIRTLHQQIHTQCLNFLKGSILLPKVYFQEAQNSLTKTSSSMCCVHWSTIIA